jgi:hypothetical protein
VDTAPPDSELIDDLVALGRAAGEGSGADNGVPTVLADRPDVLVVRVGGVVVKAHAPGADAAALAVRLRLAADPRLRGIFLPPFPSSRARPDQYAVPVRRRLVTLWPTGRPVSPHDPDTAPWKPAAVLLARLHAIPLMGPGEHLALPTMGGPRRVARALARLRSGPGGDTSVALEVLRAATTLPLWAVGRAPAPGGSVRTLVHGDWHLGQMVRPVPESRTDGPAPGPGPGDGYREGTVQGWRLIDVDDLGVGEPAWDLARPAAWYATGLLAHETWWAFLSAYRAAGGCAVPTEGDPWLALDVPARALVVQTAALALAAAVREDRPLDEAEEAVVAACRRIAGVDMLPETS